MYYGPNEGWDKFWENRSVVLTPQQKSPFLKNFAVMWEIIIEHYRSLKIPFTHFSVLEIGAGRGTISDMFRSRGCLTACTDLFDYTDLMATRLRAQHGYIKHDILKDEPLEEKFDVIVTYGLLEHFDINGKISILRNTSEMLNDTGISVHYVVPKKWTNMGESGEVYRDKCNDLLSLAYPSNNPHIGIVHVFPYFKSMYWLCRPFFSKGFIIWNGKTNEKDTCSCNR